MNWPVVIHSSPKALLSKYFGPSFIFLILLVITIIIKVDYKPFPVIVMLIMAAVYGIKIPLAYLRIKHTVYKIYQNKLESNSYLFKFMGVSNNVINLAQLRQIKAFSNSYFDVWFFNCGKVIITVSGDYPDFIMTNVYKPMVIKAYIEKCFFGETASSNQIDKASI